MDTFNKLIRPLLLTVLLASSIVGWSQGYVNVAPAQGVDIAVFGDTYGNGCSFYDFDNDGWDDLSFAMRNDSLVFYRNVEGQFERQPSFVMAPGQTKHVLWADYDNDGDLDLLVTTFLGTYRLYRNDGNGSFTHVSEQVGLAQITEQTYGAAFGDYDRDGDLDLYVCVYSFEGDESNFARLNHLYRNNGDGTFTDVTLEAGVGNGIRMSFQAVWFDYDNDGWSDLYVINDRWYANTLYRNNGDGTFTDVTAASNTAVEGQDVMSATVGDFDNDGDLDVYMTNTGSFFKLGLLLVNQGDGTFVESAAQYGVDLDKWAWGATWVDHDNDRYQDLYVTTSLPNLAVEDNYFYRNMAGVQFNDGADVFTGDHNARSFCVGRGDINNDGYYDLLVQNQSPWLPFLWQNTGGTNHYIKVTLSGTVSNRYAIGSWIKVYADGVCQTQYTLCGENYIGQNSQHHIIGLGTSTSVDSVQVIYPSGHMDTYYQPGIDQSHLLTEGETYSATITPLGPTQLCQGGQVVLDAGEHASYLWNNGHTGRFLNTGSPGTYTVSILTQHGLLVTSPALEVTVHPLPFISADVVHPSCATSADGSISLVNLAGPALSSVTWDNGQTGAAIAPLAGGTYTYTCIDANGCTSNGAVELIDPPVLELFVETAPESGGGDGSIDLFIFGGTTPYNVFLEGEPAGTTVEGLAAGAYAIEVQDAQGCTTNAWAIVDDHTGLPERMGLRVIVHPNPTHGTITISTSSPVELWHVFDVHGRPVMRASGRPMGVLELGHLPSGCYRLLGIVGGRLVASATILLIPSSSHGP